MSGAHTPGPWTDGNEAIHSQIDRKHPWCGTVFQRNRDGTEADALVAMSFAATPDEAEANARLIAAAPELLEACERMVAATEADQHFIGEEHEAMKTAIAKARGEA